MVSKPPGAEFLERRLARATAVPPAERSPDVAAFVESVQVQREVEQLLPLTTDGRAALPDTLATRRKVGCQRLATHQISAAAHQACRPEGNRTLSACLTPAGAAGNAQGGAH
jgi:hypothetical protein